MVTKFAGILLLAFSLGLSKGGSDISYSPKALFREYKKQTGTELMALEEIVLNKDLAGKYRMQGKFFRPNSPGQEAHFIYIGRVNTCRASGCSIDPTDDKQGASEYFDYFIFFDKAKVVRHVHIYNYQATHGHEISARGWLRQFFGYDGNKWLETGKDIDGISGATISVNGITNDICLKTQILKEITYTE
jgi:hypothetical protein